MAIQVQCPCGRLLTAPEQFAGRRGECQYCGRMLQIPQTGAAAAAVPSSPQPTRAKPGTPFEVPMEITEFLDPPSAPIETERKPFSLRPMFEALLDPRSIHWMLILGGGLSVLGLIVWLTSLGLFANKLVLAVVLGAGTLLILGSGWLVVLKTRFQVAGQALTFLGCVVAPLNLWFYHAQGLVTLGNNLWVGGLVCSLLYIATVYVLRDPLFMYAVEAGITLTVALLLADLGVAADTVYLCTVLLGMGLVSIHAERAFPPEAETFTRRRFGMPLFWSGHAQLGLALAILAGTQLAGWLFAPAQRLLGVHWSGNLLSESTLLAGGLWLAGMYAYLYSDIVVRRIGVYTLLAALCLILAEVTMVGARLQGEALIATLALTALAANLVHCFLARQNDRVSRVVPPLAMALAALPIAIGVVLHVRATSTFLASELPAWTYDTGWGFVLAMFVVAVCNRVSAYLYRRTSPAWSGVYFFASAAGLIVAAAGLLRELGLTVWRDQAPLLILIPIAYMVASRLWRGHSPERPLYWVAHAATAVILVPVVVAALDFGRPGMGESLLRPVQEARTNLLLGLVFAEAAVFYVLGALFRRRSANVYLAAATGCGALWQLLGYYGLPGPYYTMFYAALGAGLLAVGRGLGVEQIEVYRPTGQKGLATRGKGLAAFQTGNAILLVALLASLLQGLMRLAVLLQNSSQRVGWLEFSAMILTAVAAAVAVGLSPKGTWRRVYATACVALAAVTFLTLNVLIELSAWQKLEIFCVAAGVLLVAASYVGRFREEPGQQDDTVTVGLWLGSLLATLPLLIAVLYHRLPATGMAISLWDELALLTVTVLMLVTGFSWQIKSTTVFGGSALALYLLLLVVSLGWQQQQPIGVYLAIGGGVIFALGIALSVYREKLLQLPEQVAKREGIFRVINWR